jgi:predicted O-methyltransferase YrrM
MLTDEIKQLIINPDKNPHPFARNAIERLSALYREFGHEDLTSDFDESYYLEKFEDFIRVMYEEGFKDREGRAKPRLFNAYDGFVLYHLQLKEKIKKSFEVGMATGASTVFLCQGLEDSKEESENNTHTAIDPAQKADYLTEPAGSWNCTGIETVSHQNLSHRLHFKGESSHLVLPKMLENGDRFQLAFIDGMHLFDYAFLDFFYSDLLIEPDGIIIFDDIWMDSILTAILFVLKNRDYGLVKVGENQTITVLRKLHDDRRGWNFHVDFAKKVTQYLS